MTLFLAFGFEMGSQSTPEDSAKINRKALNDALFPLRKQAGDSHATDQIREEIEYRRQLFQEEWAAYRKNPKSIDEYDRYGFVVDNDLALARLLEGSEQFSDAEAILRHNQAELASERIAGNDIKAENELQLAHVVEKEGMHLEASQICSHWKHKMRRIPGRQDSDHFYGIPRTPVYDTPEVEKAMWDFNCGDPDQAMKLVLQQISVHPHMLFSFSVLKNYYESQGEFQKARKAELDGSSAITTQ